MIIKIEGIDFEIEAEQYAQKVRKRIEARGKDRIRNGEYQWQWRWERNDWGEITLTNAIGFGYRRQWRTSNT